MKFFEFGSVFQMSFKRFLIWSFGSPPVWCSRTIYAILKDGIMGNIHAKLYGNWTSGSKVDVYSRHFLSRALTTPLFSRPKPFVQFWKNVS